MTPHSLSPRYIVVQLKPNPKSAEDIAKCHCCDKLNKAVPNSLTFEKLFKVAPRGELNCGDAALELKSTAECMLAYRILAQQKQIPSPRGATTPKDCAYDQELNGFTPQGGVAEWSGGGAEVRIEFVGAAAKGVLKAVDRDLELDELGLKGMSVGESKEITGAGQRAKLEK